MEDCVEINIIGERPRLGLRGQLLGTSQERSEVLQSLETPFGQLTVVNQDGATIARGEGFPEAVVEAPDSVGVAQVKRGIAGRVDDRRVTIVRPRYGFRRRNRSVLIDGGAGISWCTHYRSNRHFEIRRREDGSVVYGQDGSRRYLDANATPSDVALAAAVAASGIIQTSSLLNSLTLP